MRNDNELVNQLIKMSDVHIMMHSDILSGSEAFIYISMCDNNCDRVVRNRYTRDEIDIYGFELLLTDMYRELKGYDHAEEK